MVENKECFLGWKRTGSEEDLEEAMIVKGVVKRMI